MPRPVRVRNLAKTLGMDEADLLLWLSENAPDTGALHPAGFVPAEIVDRAQQALGRPAPPRARVEPRCVDCMSFPVPAGVTLVAATAEAACGVCGGSVNKRAAMELIQAFRDQGL